MDIARCSGKGCNMRDLCHRYSKSTFRKYDGAYSEFIEPPFNLNKDGIWKCDYFVGTENKIE